MTLRIDDAYVDLLDAWEHTLPLVEASHLAGREMALHLYALCDGNYGRLASVLRRAAAEAITSGRERVTIELLDDMGFRTPASFSVARSRPRCPRTRILGRWRDGGRGREFTRGDPTLGRSRAQ